MRKNSTYLVLALTNSLLACTTNSPGPGAPPTPPQNPAPPPPAALSSALVVEGPEETVVAIGQYGQWNIPDGTISFLRMAGELRLWVAGLNGSGYRFTGSSLEAIAPNPVAAGQAVPVINPDPKQPFEQDYAAPGAVLPDGSDLVMIYHTENHRCANATGQQVSIAGKSYNSIALARSSDGGLTWKRQGRIITGPQPDLASICGTGFDSTKAFRGAGQPAVIRSHDGKWFYTYFTEWREPYVPGLLIARASVKDGPVPGAWKKYDAATEDFTAPGLAGVGTDVITNADSAYGGFAAMPSVSFNTYLNRYVAVFMGHVGFYYSTSADGIHWEASRLLWSVQGLTTSKSLPDGASWYYYPSLITPDEASHETTGQSAWLYYAHGRKLANPNPSNAGAHYMVRRKVQIGFVGQDFPSPVNRPTEKTFMKGEDGAPPTGWNWVCQGDVSSLKPDGSREALYDDIDETGLVTVWPRGGNASVAADYGARCQAVSDAEIAQAVRDAEVRLIKESGCTRTCKRVSVAEIGVDGTVRLRYEGFLILP